MIELDITNKEYRARDAISSSDVKAAAKSLAHWKGASIKSSPAFDLGTAYHELCLEPHKASIIRGPVDRRGNNWKEAKAAADAEGKLLLTESDFDVAQEMAKVALEQPRINALINAQDAMIEASIFVTCPETGLKLKTRPDCYVPSKSACIDLKSTVDAGPGEREFSSQLWKYKYDIQAAFYAYCCTLADLPVQYFCFVATEKVSPYATCLHVLANEVMEHAHTKMLNILKRIARAKEEDDYPTDWPDMNMIHLPEWMQN